jgi:nucleoside-diphosphate-sugar epimerase
VARVLIAGCGYVGSVVAELFREAGWEVEGWTRSAASAAQLAGKGLAMRVVDMANAGQVAASPKDFQAVIHSASSGGGDAAMYRRVYLEGVRNLQSRFPEARILFTSSTSVYAQDDGEWVTEESPAQPEHETGEILREAEQDILERGGQAARLAGIYGPGRSALLQRVLRNEAVIDPENDRFVNQVHRDDAAAALFRLIEKESGTGIYNVADAEPVLLSECYRWLAERLSRPLPPVAKTAAERRRGTSNKRVSSQKLRALGWEPRYPSFAEGMEQSVLPDLAKMPI